MRIRRERGLPAPGKPGICWLGQAGFWIETGAHRILIDPYLSDSLAKKYAGRTFDHKRMMPPPLSVADLPRPDIVLVTHAHTDHMDPETLAPLHARFPDVPFVVPVAREAAARERIGSDARLLPVDAGADFAAIPGLRIVVFPAAHEDFDCDDAGRHPYLGYGIAAAGIRLYHSGDCVPFPELPALYATFAPDIALLPVNGRDAERRANGVPGNFTLDEAVHLAADTAYLVPHHFGMFAFNTIDPKAIAEAAARRRGSPTILIPESGETLAIA